MATSSSCPKCGTMKKSGTMSCCGRGGSWFGNCASAGHTKVHHTWQEGIRACKDRQFQTAVAQTSHGSRPKNNNNSDTSIDDLDAVVVAAHMIGSAPIPAETPVPISVVTLIIMPAHTSQVRGSGQIAPRTTTTSTTTIVHTSVKTTTPNKINSEVSETITALTNWRNDLPFHPNNKFQNNVVMNKLMTSASADMSMTTVSFVSDAASVTAQKYVKLLHTISHISTIFILFS